MKKFFLILGILCFTAAVNAQAQAQGGFVGPSDVPTGIITVKAAKDLKDDSYVTLQGNVTKKVADEKYMFTDGTDSILIEVDDEDWRGINATPETKIQIQGEVDKHLMKEIEIDVDMVTLVQ